MTKSSSTYQRCTASAIPQRVKSTNTYMGCCRREYKPCVRPCRGDSRAVWPNDARFPVDFVRSRIGVRRVFLRSWSFGTETLLHCTAGERGGPPKGSAKTRRAIWWALLGREPDTNAVQEPSIIRRVLWNFGVRPICRCLIEAISPAIRQRPH